MTVRRKAGVLCMILGTLLLAAAAGLLIFNQIEANKAAKASEDILPVLTDAIRSDENDNPLQEMPTVEIDGYAYIGYLSIPALGLELPVMDEWDYTRLKTAPCRYFGSVYSDNLVIAGHNYAGHFGRLSALEIGDTVRFTAVDGTVYTYRVGDMEMLPPTATEEMIVSDWDLTLYTCTRGGTKRVTVRCERITA